MAKKGEDGGRSFKDFLAAAPSLDDAASDDSVELTGLVSRTTDGRFAISTHEGQTYELDVDAVLEFREVEGLASAAAIRVGRDVLEKAVLRPVKPLRKDVIKDVIKDIIKDVAHDGKHLITDPLVDKQPPLDKHPPLDTFHGKDLHKDPLTDPVTYIQEQIGTGPGDALVDPGDFGQVVNPAVNAAAGAPFVMATPHQAPAHLLSLQAGVQAAPTATAMTLATIDQLHKRIDTLKEVNHDTQKELIYDTRKELIPETHKELIIDTQKEIYETLVEGGPWTTVEGNPGFPGQGFPGQPGFLG
jgi:hypothetical protein